MNLTLENQPQLTIKPKCVNKSYNSWGWNPIEPYLVNRRRLLGGKSYYYYQITIILFKNCRFECCVKLPIRIFIFFLRAAILSQLGHTCMYPFSVAAKANVWSLWRSVAVVIPGSLKIVVRGCVKVGCGCCSWLCEGRLGWWFRYTKRTVRPTKQVNNTLDFYIYSY